MDYFVVSTIIKQSFQKYPTIIFTFFKISLGNLVKTYAWATFAKNISSIPYLRTIPKRFYIYYKFGNEEKAHDAVQEAFVKLWENCTKVTQEKAKAYLYTVANNLYLNVIKAEKVRLKYADQHSNSINKESPEFLLEEKQFQKNWKMPLMLFPKINGLHFY